VRLRDIFLYLVRGFVAQDAVELFEVDALGERTELLKLSPSRLSAARRSYASSESDTVFVPLCVCMARSKGCAAGV